MLLLHARPGPAQHSDVNRVLLSSIFHCSLHCLAREQRQQGQIAHHDAFARSFIYMLHNSLPLQNCWRWVKDEQARFQSWLRAWHDKVQSAGEGTVLLSVLQKMVGGDLGCLCVSVQMFNSINLALPLNWWAIKIIFIAISTFGRKTGFTWLRTRKKTHGEGRNNELTPDRLGWNGPQFYLKHQESSILDQCVQEKELKLAKVVATFPHPPAI